jgi:hypothetical protein
MEQDAMEVVLDEMEEEHEEVFARIDVLEVRLPWSLSSLSRCFHCMEN